MILSIEIFYILLKMIKDLKKKLFIIKMSKIITYKLVRIQQILFAWNIYDIFLYKKIFILFILKIIKLFI